MAKYDKALLPGTMLHGKKNSYRIDRVLGQGTFGITYLAYTTVTVEGDLGKLQTEIQVAVKEFFMSDINGREGSTVTTGGSSELFGKYRHKFAREASNLAKLKHRGIVKVIETFEANGTSYYAMEYCGGGSLDSRIKACDGLPEAEALRYFAQIAEALQYMHSQRMLHLDLKPGNVMLRSSGEAVLIDFGLSKQFNDNGEPESSTTLGGGTPGYAPLEQANYKEDNDGNLPVTMDIYALGGTLYKMLTGERPPVASDVLMHFPEEPLRAHNVSNEVIAAIRHAMQPKPTDRYPTVAAFAADCTSEATETIELEVKLLGYERIDAESRPAVETAEPEVRFLGYERQDAKPRPVLKPQRQQNNLLDIAMVYVSGGTFTMGATSEQDNDAGSNEKPAHSVTLDGYYIGKYEVTQALWKAVMGSNPSKFKGENLPVENVSWNDVQEFIQKLNTMTGKNYRLPTEAEWEFAARGGNNSHGYKYSGSNNISKVAWYLDNSDNRTHTVGTKFPNELGIYDMSGNVYEWCQDCYDDYGNSPQTNPKSTNNRPHRVCRGGSWKSDAKYCRGAFRCSFSLGNKGFNLGFRLAL